ncbi:MAG: sodium/solute symporter [Verrucomicrobiales bacterium]|nr:sodium/solute symporter [Verrucomicrobiales bacterium]
MNFTALDFAIFIGFYGLVLGFSFAKSRGQRDSADYFLGGRRLPWWLIGVSIVAANLSTEQFVGMAGQAAGNVGLAVSAWQLTGAVGIVVVAFVFLPRFLSAGIYTMPEYLEYRYNAAARGIMSVLTVVIYATVTTSAVLYSGGTALETIFGLDLRLSIVVIAALGVAYVMWGGLLAAVWADLFQGTALLLGGLVTIGLGVVACGGPTEFLTRNADRLHMVLPADHAELPWTVLLSGMWIPIFYYCGLNQFITQRALAAGSLKQGQLGVIFAGALWLLVPVAIVMPGIAAHQLYGSRLERLDQAYPMLVRELVPNGVRGFILASLAGAVVSSLASMLNSASTIFTMDLWKRYWDRGASEATLVRVGRVSTLVFLVLACVVSLSDLLKGGVFKFIQEFQGYISPGILAAFVFGFAVRRAPPSAGVTALVASAPVYGVLQYFWGDIAYLHRMSLTLVILIAVMALITWNAPLKEPRSLPVRTGFDMRPSASVKWAAALVLGGVALYFVVFF